MIEFQDEYGYNYVVGVEEVTKVCSKCKQDKRLSEFYKQNDRKSGFRSACKKCCDEYRKKNQHKYNEYVKDWNRRNPDKIKNAKLIREFGITLEQYNNMFTEQQGCCAVCGKHQSELKKSLAVDHDHESGAIRQLLCNHCNLILGLVQDNISLLEDFIEYVQKH